jgi:hypothetical protein
VRRFFTLGWLGLHALAVLLITAFLAAGYWQLQRAGAGNMRSWAYAFEWPLFAVFVAAMWVKMIHDELTGKTAGGAEPDRAGGGAGGRGSPGDPGETAGTGRTGVDDAFDDADDPELAAYNRYLARLNAEASPEV